MIRSDKRYTARTQKIYDYSRFSSDLSVTLDDLRGGLDGLDLFQALLGPVFLSPSFRTLLDDIADHWVLCFEHLPDGDYAIDVEEQIVWVDTSGMTPNAIMQSIYFSNTVRGNTIRAIREIWHAQKAHGTKGVSESLSIDSRIKAERIKAADVECFTLLCAYETQSYNAPSELWRHALGGDCGDMAIVFSRTLERTMNAHNRPDLAMQEAFKQWYADVQRVDSCDHRTLEELDQMLLEAQEQGRHNKYNVVLKASEICMMTQRGNGHGSYLGDLNIRLLRDPAYADIHDSINQAHLMHIMHDLEVTRVANVPFRSAELAKKIFPTNYETVPVDV